MAFPETTILSPVWLLNVMLKPDTILTKGHHCQYAVICQTLKIYSFIPW